MQRIFSFFTILCLAVSIAMVSFNAEARRFGGGGSFGKAPSHFSRQATPSKPMSTPNKANPTPGRNWLGPLAGFAAGGLLASLLMGGHFGGINFFDIIIIALLAFFVIRFLRTKTQTQSTHNNPIQTFQNNEQSTSPIFGTQRTPTSTPVQTPAWFNADSFLAAAREHFMALQQHWDANEMDKIAEYVNPELLAFLKQERTSAGDSYQSTYIDDLNVTLDGVDDNRDKTVATLTFSGIEKSSRFDQGEPFNESWRMEREQGENKPWLIAGIRQN